MKRQLMTGLFAALAFTAVAQSNEWRDPEVNAVNRAPMHANFFAYETAEVAAKDPKEFPRTVQGHEVLGTIPELHDLERSLEILLGKER